MNDQFRVGIRSHAHRSVYKTAGGHIFESAEWRSEAVKSVIRAGHCESGRLAKRYKITGSGTRVIP